MTSNIIILKPNGLPNDEFEDDDIENELDKTVLAKFLLRQIIKNEPLSEYFFELEKKRTKEVLPNFALFRQIFD